MNVFELQDRCEKLRAPGYLQLTVSIIILIGLMISYLPQHYRIVSRGTSEGISPWFVLLGTTSATSGFANILLVGPSRQDIACCKTVETFECLAGLLGIAQLGVQWVCFALILVLFLVFFRYGDANVPADELVEDPPKWQTAVMVGSLSFFHGLIVVVLSGVFALAAPSYLDFWAALLGVMAAALAGVQYIPQIWTTYHLKHVGSLSIPMMCIQTPGGFLFAGSLFSRLGWAGWSTWGIFLITATAQGTLLSMAVYYELLAHRDASSSDATLADGNANGSSSPGGGLPRPLPQRQYSEGWQDGLPGPYSAHAERYADTPEELDRLREREERQAARDENKPLLRPGGIGAPRRNYNSTQVRH